MPELVVWLRSPSGWRALLTTAILMGCFIWAMIFVGFSFAVVEHGGEQWWLMPLFGVLMPVRRLGRDPDRPFIITPHR